MIMIMVIQSWLQWFPPFFYFLFLFFYLSLFLFLYLCLSPSLFVPSSFSLPPSFYLPLSVSLFLSPSLCLTLSHAPSLYICSLLFLHLLSCSYLCHFLSLFVWYTERCTNEVMAVGINSVREILVRVPAILREPDMGDFIEGTHYKYTTQHRTQV